MPLPYILKYILIPSIQLGIYIRRKSKKTLVFFSPGENRPPANNKKEELQLIGSPFVPFLLIIVLLVAILSALNFVLCIIGRLIRFRLLF